MSFTRHFLSVIVPKGLRRRIQRWKKRNRLWRNYRYDIDRFEKYASPFRDFKNAAQIRAFVQMLSHSLEKGLSLREARSGFGQEKARELMAWIATHFRDFGWNDELSPAIGCLKQYLEFQTAAGTAMTSLRMDFDRLTAMIPTCGPKFSSTGGTIRTTRAQIHRDARRDLAGFFSARHSIREFSGEPVGLDIISGAIRLAQRTPSVCNRQSARVYVFGNDELGQKILACQNGNRGFGHLADKILIVTTDLRNFLAIGERNQCWIDGGMFAMSLIYALHSFGVGTCCLNWSVEHDADERLRTVASIPSFESVIMMIAVGQLPETLTVACSARKPLEEVLRVRCDTPPVESCAQTSEQHASVLTP